jgi:hypothetical protein
MNFRTSLMAGILALGGWIIGLLLSAKAALLGWLVAFIAFASVPVGCLAVLMMVILVPGRWRSLYTGPLLLGSALLPVAAIALVPILLGVAILYGWAEPGATAGYPAFKAAWLSPGFFIVRQILYFVILIGLWLAILLVPPGRSAVAALGLIVYALIASWIGVDLAESVTPDFHSSIYGLIMLAGGWMSAVAVVSLLGAGSRSGPAPLSAAGAFMVALLAWAYLHAMQFIVIWSGDIPEEVGWYLVRGTGGWAWVTAALYLLQGFVPFFAMLSPAIRSSWRMMGAIAALTLVMRGVESAWLILPGEPAGWPVFVLALLALVGMAGLGMAIVSAMRRRRPAWFEWRGLPAASLR